MNNTEFEKIITEQFDRCRETLLKKAEEYADDTDRLHNFKVAARLQGVTPLTAAAGTTERSRQMKGNKEIAQILKQDYDINDLTPFEDISYEIEHYTDELSRVKIQSNSGECFCCPVYAMFDGYHMSWYGDYGFWGFTCTWKTNITNLAYNSPYYQLEKLESRERTEFDSERCENEFLRMIKESDWYNYNLTEKQRKSFDKFITDDFHDYVDCDDCLFEIAEKCENLKVLKNATYNETEWYSALGRNNLDESDIYEIFGCEEYELYTIGNKVPGRFFIILYMLSVVAEVEKAVQQMNNRYIFRGKRTDNGEWVEGDLVRQSNHSCFQSSLKYQHFIYKDICLDINLGGLEEFEVVPETVGQCTGLKDKTGKWIFEGDVVEDTGSGICYFIKWFPECACYSLANKDGQMNFGCDELEMFLDDLKVIGNIHDDKNLTEVER